jgi:hypothetical protein
MTNNETKKHPPPPIIGGFHPNFFNGCCFFIFLSLLFQAMLANQPQMQSLIYFGINQVFEP